MTCGPRSAALAAFAIAIVLATRGTATATDASLPRIDVAGTLQWPADAVAADGSTVAIDGVSGVTWLGDDDWLAVMDTGAALLSFQLVLEPDGRPAAIRDVRAVRLAERHDYEDVAPCPPGVARGDAAAGRTLLLCEEDTPALRIVTASGARAGSLPLPEVFRTRRPNRGFEAVAAAADGSAVWIANEEALPDDGPPPGNQTGTVVRIAEVPCVDARDLARGRQLAYAVDPPHACVTVAAGEAYSGLVALAVLADGRLLALERSAAACLPPFENRIYVVDPAAAPDVADVSRDLAARPELHVGKRLAWRGGLGCNLEGLALGPPLAAGGTALVAVADAGGLSAPSHLVVLRLDPPLTTP